MMEETHAFARATVQFHFQHISIRHSLGLADQTAHDGHVIGEDGRPMSPCSIASIMTCSRVRIRLKHLRQFERIAFKQKFRQEDRRQVHSDLLVRASDAVVIDKPLQRIARFILDGVPRAIRRDAS